MGRSLRLYVAFDIRDRPEAALSERSVPSVFPSSVGQLTGCNHLHRGLVVRGVSVPRTLSNQLRLRRRQPGRTESDSSDHRTVTGAERWQFLPADGAVIGPFRPLL